MSSAGEKKRKMAHSAHSWRGKLDLKLAVHMHQSMHRTIWSEVKDMMGHGESDVHSVESSHSKAGDA